MAESNKIYRVRRGFGGKCVLQVLADSPSLIGGHVDASIRDLSWVDVDYERAPIVLTARVPQREPQKCPTCAGKGKVRDIDNISVEVTTCPACHGTGWV